MRNMYRLFDTYSLAVIEGLRQQGIPIESLCRPLKISQERLARMLRGQAEFTPLQEDKIGNLSGKTCGQLAAAATEPHGGELTKIMDLWAEAIPPRKLRNKSSLRSPRRKSKVSMR